MGIIYLITSPSGKRYVGQTRRSLEQRMKQHQNPKSGCPILSASIRKYGWNRMSVQVLQECSNEELNDLERFYIKGYNCLSPEGMNCTSGGDAGYTFSEEHRLKSSETQRGDTLGNIRKCPSGKFRARISIMGQLYHVGNFDSREESQIQIDSFYAKYNPHYTDEMPPMENRAKSGMGYVRFDKHSKKYISTIQRNGICYFCGAHVTKFDAQEYIDNFNTAYDPQNPPPYPKKRAKNGMGSVSCNRHRGGKFVAQIKRLGTVHRLGSFPTEAAAREALEKFKASLDVTTPAPKGAV